MDDRQRYKTRSKKAEQADLKEEIWRIVTAIAFLLAMILGVAADTNKK